MENELVKDFEGKEKKKVDDENEKKSEEVVEKKDEAKKVGREKKMLDKEERWKRIQEQRKLELQHAPPLPFLCKPVRNNYNRIF